MSHDTSDDTADQVSVEELRKRRYERRLSAHRSADRVLARLSLRETLRQRLALLDQAAQLFDLDETVDLYGNGIVEVLEEKVAKLLGQALHIVELREEALDVCLGQTTSVGLEEWAAGLAWQRGNFHG